jgi:hypothetical protein
MEVIEETLPEEQPEEQPDSEAVETADTDATAEAETPADTIEGDGNPVDGDPEDAQHQADLDRAAEAAVEAMEILGKIEDATRNVDNAAMRVAKAKGQLKFAKEIYEDYVEHLKELCRTRMEKHPLFDGPASDQNDSPSEPKTGEGGPSPDKDAWKELPLSDLGLPAGILKSLLSADITKIGELCDEMNADPLSWHEDISGIGPVAIEAIAKKFAEFWREHPEWDNDGDDGEIDAEYDDDEGESDDDEDSDEDESNEDDE